MAKIDAMPREDDSAAAAQWYSSPVIGKDVTNLRPQEGRIHATKRPEAENEGEKRPNPTKEAVTNGR